MGEFACRKLGDESSTQLKGFFTTFSEGTTGACDLECIDNSYTQNYAVYIDYVALGAIHARRRDQLTRTAHTARLD